MHTHMHTRTHTHTHIEITTVTYIIRFECLSQLKRWGSLWWRQWACGSISRHGFYMYHTHWEVGLR